MTEEDILATTYYDVCTIYRKGDAVKDPDTKQSSQAAIMVAEDVPCALSTAKGGSINLSGGHGSVDGSYTLFCRPDVDIQAGDKIIVVKGGRSYSLWAGLPFTYASSHTETPLSGEEPT